MTFPGRWFILEQAQDAALPDCKGDNPHPLGLQDKPGPALFTTAPSFAAGLQHNKTWFAGLGLF